MSTLPELLPGNATRFEEGLAHMLDTRSRIRPVLTKIRDMLDDVDAIPSEWLPWFILNDGLEILLPYLSERLILKEGRKWIKLLGSEDAIHTALSWMDITDATLHYEPDEDQKFDLFQVEIPGSIPVSYIPKLIALVELSKPTTDLLGRIYAGNAGNAFRLDYSRLDDVDRLDHWDGVNLPGIDPPVYFESYHSGEVYAGPVSVDFYIHTIRALETRFIDGFILDSSRLDDEIIEPGVVYAAVSVVSTHNAEVDQKQAPWPVDTWPSFIWPDIEKEVF